MVKEAKETVQRYSLWIAAGMLLIAVGGQISTCSGGVFSAGKTIEGKASAARVRTLEVQQARMQECLSGIKSKQSRMIQKIDKMDDKLDRLLESKAK